MADKKLNDKELNEVNGGADYLPGVDPTKDMDPTYYDAIPTYYPTPVPTDTSKRDLDRLNYPIQGS